MKYARTITALIEPRRANSSGRIVRYRFSTPAVARDGHAIAAWRLDNFRLNPVFLWAHDSREPPIGKVIELADKNGYLDGTVEYAERDAYPFADVIFQLVRDGYINAVSTSWDPIEWSWSADHSRPGGIDFKLVDLLELSQVPVPALPTALASARAAGVDVTPMAAWAERCLDEGSTIMPRTALASVRRAAGAPSPSMASSRPRIPAQPRQAAGSWSSLGEQLCAIRAAGAAPERGVDSRLNFVRYPTGMFEADPSAGGFAIEAQYAQDLVGIAYEEATIAPLCDRRETQAPLADVNVPAIDETSRADGSRWGGTLAYWSTEAASVTASMPRFKNLAFSAKKLIAVVVVSNELFADVPMLDAHIRRAYAAELSFNLDLVILRGDGAGKPLGFLNSPALITIAKQTGQASATIVAANVSQMWTALPAPSRRRAVWLVNEDADTQLEQLTLTVGSAGAPAATAVAMYMPAGANGNEYPLLKGRPVLAIEQCPQLGTLGDIVLADLNHYVLIDGGNKPAISADCLFLEDQTVFRFVLRVDGTSAFASPISPYNGSPNKRSPFVALAAR